MLSTTEREAIRCLMEREIVPTIGCTEPIAVSLCVAKTAELLEHRPEKIDVFLSSSNPILQPQISNNVFLRF